MNGTFREVSNCRATHEATCAEVKKASQRTADLKRKRENAFPPRTLQENDQ